MHGCLVKATEYCAGIFKQSTGARNRVGIGLSYWPGRLYKTGGIDFLDSIPGPLKRLKIRALSPSAVYTLSSI